MKSKWSSDRVLKWVNRGLLTAIIFVNGFIIIAPLWPKLLFLIRTNITKPVKVDVNNVDSLASINRGYNHLIIPKLQLDEYIYDGVEPAIVHLGIWRRPNTARPGEKSNSVLVGHRFTYTAPAVLYNLDQIKEGDVVVVVWEGKLYIYEVDGIKEVPPTATEVEAPTDHETLTIYTCTPLLTAANRLVVTTKFIEVKE